jgi:hypothetical protein
MALQVPLLLLLLHITTARFIPHTLKHKVLTYKEYRAVSGVFRTIDLPTPSPPSECVLRRTKGGAIHTRRAVRGWGVNILEDARHWIGSYSVISVRMKGNVRPD